jgi:exodeoxyribonuclease VII large subunit
MSSTQPGIRLSEFTALILQTLEDRFAGQTFWVIAEISNLNHYARTHTFYFHLIEKEEGSGQIKAEVSAVAFSQAAYEIEGFEQLTGQVFKNGIQVLINVSVNYHPVHGLKVNLNKIDASFTIGQLQQQREATLAKLLADNPDAVKLIQGRYHTRNQEVPLPFVIQNIAVISSENSAGLQDFRHTLTENSFSYQFEIRLFQTLVQGDEQGKQLVDRLIEIFRAEKKYDIVVIVRGGGAQTDFLMFDAYPLARAVARFPIPVITGLGHQKDVSVCDLMAHTALKTPTKAAEFILAHNRNFEENIVQFQHQILIRSQQVLIREKERIALTNQQIQRATGLLISKHSEFLNSTRQKVISQSTGLVYIHARNLNLLSRQMSTRPALIVGKAKHDLSSYTKELQASLTRFTQKQENYLGHYKTVFKLLSPATTLKRGFALVLDQGRILTDATNIKKGDSVQVYLNGSELDVTITKKQKNNGDQFDL